MIRGWCPGALRPMPTGDGLIARLRISGGIVDIALARQIARWSSRWGNGQIDLSNRGNLQLRGLAAQHLSSLRDALAEWDLLDRGAAEEAVRNVIASPLSGLDPTAALDVRPVVKALETCLGRDASLRRLPAKFGFAIDDGGLLGLDDAPADIRFTAARMDDGPLFAIRLDGAPEHSLGCCRPNALPEVAAALSHQFLRLRADRQPDVRRVRDLVRALGVETVARDTGLNPVRSVPAGRLVHPTAILGAHSLGVSGFLGVGLPFGSIKADHFARFAEVAAASGVSSLRLTPWRAVLLPVDSLHAARALSVELATDKNVILDAADPRRRVAACPGAPACRTGGAPTRRDAAEMAVGLEDAPGWDTVLHVSGCEKGCAHPRRAPVTLVGREGRYDLVRDGRASDPPELRGLTSAQAAEQVRQALALLPLGGAA